MGELKYYVYCYHYIYYPKQKPNMERENNYTPGNETYDEETDGVRRKERKCEITTKTICMSFVLVIIIVALSLALYFKSRMHFQNATDQSELTFCNETIPNCNGRIINATEHVTQHPPIH